MKGGIAALLLGKAAPKGPPMPEDESAEEAPDSESAEGEGGDEREYAKLVIDALKGGDDESAADALVSLVKCCR